MGFYLQFFAVPSISPDPEHLVMPRGASYFQDILRTGSNSVVGFALTKRRSAGSTMQPRNSQLALI